jgi:hypothetical protein
MHSHHKLRILLKAVIGCKSSSDNRQSHDYLQYDHCLYHHIAAFSGVIEPQQDGHLYWHIMLYSGVLSPELLEKAAAAPMKLQTQVAEMLDSITCTTLPPHIHQWYNDTIATIQHGTKRPWAADIDVPDASSDYIGFLYIEMEKSLLTGMYGHGFCCEKRKKGKYMCCLVFKQGLHEEKICAILVILFKSENVANIPLDKDIVAMLNTPNDALAGALKQQHPMRPIVWEQTRNEQDAYYCENNIIITNIVGCASNSSLITSTTSGKAPKEYMSKYMVKEKASLKQAVPSLLAALDEIIVHPSKAENTGTAICTGKYLAQCTINAFLGSHQWSMPLMASALLGNRSIISLELYCFVFPHANVSYVNSLLPSRSDLSNEQNKPTSSVDDNNEYAQSCLDAVMAAVSKDDEHNEFCGGTTSYKTTDGTVLFLTQAESYYHRGPVFASYSQLEFECIIQLQDKPSLAKKTGNIRGHKPRPGFQLGSGHPLYASHVGVICMKMCTPMLAGAPPPKFFGNRPIKDESHIQACFTSESLSLNIE